MNCPQCQATNKQDSAFCANCGARLAPAAAPASSGGYAPPPGQGTPVGHGASGPTDHGVPSGYGPGGPGAPADQYSPGGQYSPASQQPGGYPQGGGQYQPRPTGSVAPFQFDLKRLTQVDQIVGVATLITMISIWLPWYSVSGYGTTASFSGTWGHGWLWLEFVVALVLLGYLVMRAGWAESPVRLPVAHAPLLLVGTCVQLLLILIAFADIPYSGLGMGWDWAAFIGLLAALAAAGPLIAPAVRSYLESRR